MKIDYQNAQGDKNTNMSIVQKMVGEKVDLILAIATYSAKTHLQAIKKPITSIKTFVPGAKKVGITITAENQTPFLM